MTLHILHGCERFESTDNPEQDQPQNIPGLLRVLNASQKDQADPGLDPPTRKAAGDSRTAPPVQTR